MSPITKYFKSPPIIKSGSGEMDNSDGSQLLTPKSKNSSYKDLDIDKKIIENMASVIKSVKKKHKHKKRKTDIPETDINDISSILTNNLSIISPNVSLDNEKAGHSRSSTIGVLLENEPQKRRTSPRKLAANHIESSAVNQKPVVVEAKVSPEVKLKKEGKENKINAFKMMMNSMNKSIGGNSPGKEKKEDDIPEDNADCETNKVLKIKRKLLLENWADKKGAAKRRLNEEAEEEYIRKQMLKREKRLKKLVKNMKCFESEDEDDVNDKPLIVLRKGSKTKEISKERKRILTKTSKKIETVETKPSDGEDDKPVIISTKVSKNKKSEELGRKRKRRFCSVDSAESVDVEKGDEFVDKLSSPIKRRDSLLGYFNKIDKKTPSPESAKKTPNCSPSTPTTPAVRKKKEKSKIHRQAIEENVPLTPRTRLSRTCSSKAKNYEDFELSPEKVIRSKQTEVVTPLKIINVRSPSTMKVIKSPNVRRFSEDTDRPLSPSLGTPKRKNIKYAPLFIKSIPKPIIAPETMKARQDFLMSGIPEKMRIEIEKQKAYEDTILNESPVFPLISHIQQLIDTQSSDEVLKSRIQVCLNSPKKDESPLKFSSKIQFGMLSECSWNDFNVILSVMDDKKKMSFDRNVSKIANSKHIVREMKENYEKFPVFKCYKQFRTKFTNCIVLAAIPEEKVSPKKSKTRKSNQKRKSNLDDSVIIVETEVSAENGDLLYTEKYKPLTSDQILVNYFPALELKRFLSSWQDKKSSQYDSTDDFETSNSSIASSSICNFSVLVGPSGSGKTCSVYALANELNFNVLEINASSRRKGKIILQELHEATQSHQVRSKDENVDSFKKGIKKKRKISTDSESGCNSKKLSLILIEDADIVFDNDDGFVAAINQLISTSKRPIILTTTNANCPHLSKFISGNSIQYCTGNVNSVSKLLSIMALIENLQIDYNEIAKLYVLNNLDLRRTINELQFFIQSGGDRSSNDDGGDKEISYLESLSNDTNIAIIEDCFVDDEASRQSFGGSTNDLTAVPSSQNKKHKNLFRFFVRNQNHNLLAQFPINFDNLWCNMNKLFVSNDGDDNGDSKKIVKKKDNNDLDDLLFLYENISVAAHIQQRGEEDRLVSHLNEDIAHALVKNSLDCYCSQDGGNMVKLDELRRFSSDEKQTISSFIGVNDINSRSTYLDYEPYLRVICRCEKSRSSVGRRGTRFYHYLRNYSVVTSFNTDHFDKICCLFDE